MFQNIKWLFFDVGSTLVDEQLAYEQRFHEIAECAGVSFNRVKEQALSFYRKNKKGDLKVAEHFGVKLLKWPVEYEKPYVDAAQCLACLHQKYSIGIIANQLTGTSIRLEKYGLLPFIDLVIASAEEGVAKPDSRIFELALSRSGCLPEHAVMIGDWIDNDIMPVKRMGMHTIWIKQGFGQYWNILTAAEEPDFSVSCLRELCSIL